MNAPTPKASPNVESRSPLAGGEQGAAVVSIADLQQAITELRREFGAQSTQTEQTGELLRAIAESLGRIEEKLIEPRSDDSAATPQFERDDLDDRDEFAERDERDESSAPMHDGADWGVILLGAELGAAPQVAAEREALLADASAGQEAALGLIGQLLLFRSATAERLSPLLKDVGEAYYRWEAESTGADEAFRDEIILWLQNACAAAGLPNTIELVSPGDRFDASRHNARERGAEVVRVLGWVVLRDNGKVYTKANVAVG